MYALRESFAAGDLEVTRAAAFGIASLMFWSMMLIVTIKYIIFVMRADNHGEGGILALTALITPISRASRDRTTRWLVAFGLFGTALLYGDGMITPAISVLSAVEGLEIAAPATGPYVVPIAVVILVLLFTVQRRGTGSIGAIFGPVMIVWFTVLALLGLTHIIRLPSVVGALNPLNAIDFFARHPLGAFRSLGAVFLVVTGSEALYADMGHFGRRPIRIGWFLVVLPALTLNYLGQAALVTIDPTAIDNPFFRMAPTWLLMPLVGLATMATVIASQALITGAYSLTMQAVQLGYLPRVEIDHTSPRQVGQVYVGSVNWALMAACVALVIAFQSSANLAAAYGVAVTTTMVITTVLLYRVMRHRWSWSPVVAGALASIFLLVDLAFFSANILKVAAGGWFPLAVGLAVFTIMTTWRSGRLLLVRRLEGTELPIERFIGSIVANPQERVPGTAVFMVARPGMTPPALLANLRSNKVIHETVILTTVRFADAPTVPKARRETVHDLGEGFRQVVLTFGFMEPADVPTALCEIVTPDFGFDITDATFFLGKETVIPTPRPGMAQWRERLFAFMHRNASSAARQFRLPFNQVIEIGSQVEL